MMPAEELRRVVAPPAAPVNTAVVPVSLAYTSRSSLITYATLQQVYPVRTDDRICGKSRTKRWPAWQGRKRAKDQRHYRETLALGRRDDGYLLAAWADFAGQPAPTK
jgi:hypothetical protein